MFTYTNDCIQQNSCYTPGPRTTVPPTLWLQCVRQGETLQLFQLHQNILAMDGRCPRSVRDTGEWGYPRGGRCELASLGLIGSMEHFSWSVHQENPKLFTEVNCS